MWISSADSFYRPFLRGGRGDTSANGGEATRGHVHPPDPRRVRDGAQVGQLAQDRRETDAASQSSALALRRPAVQRVPTMRDDRLETAASLESAIKPDPKCVSALRRLLTDGCESPLYNIDVHPSEPRETPYHVRSRLPAASARPVPSE